MIVGSKAVAGKGTRDRWFRLYAPIGAALVVVSCAAAVATASGSKQAAKPALRIAVPYAFGSPNPALDQPPDLIVDELAYEPILERRSDGSVAPGLATSWRFVHTKAGPNKLFEFTLRGNARYSNGERVTAQSVKAWLDYFVKSAGPFSGLFGPNPVFTAVGKSTVRIQTEIPNPELPFALSEVRQGGDAAAPQAINKPSLFATGSYGAGPYMLDAAKTVSGDHYTFVPNPYYYDKSRIKWSQVTVKIIVSPTSTLQALKAGQIDVALGDPTTAPSAQAAGFSIVSAPAATAVVYFALQNGAVAKPLQDIRVRQALNYAIDRKAIVNALLGKYASPSSVFVTTDGTEEKYVNYYSYNPAKAKSLLAAAGYPNGFTLKVGAHAFLDDGVNDTLIQAMAKYLQAVGVTPDITTLATLGQYTDLIRSQQMAAYADEVSVLPTALQWAVFWSTKGYRVGHIQDPVINKLYYTGLKAKDPVPFWKQISARATTQAFNLPIATVHELYYVSKHVGGVTTGTGRAGAAMPLEWYPK
jgi:peptide/nickel transport system substrate-binding protein